MYYIYHIPGIKIGCSKNVELRVKEQGYSKWELLEIHEDIFIAQTREKELQKEYGYRIDRGNYSTAIQNRMKGIETRKNNGMERKWNEIGILVQQRKVHQLFGGVIIGTFDSIKEACIHNGINPLNGTKITSVCRGRRKRYLGYGWEYADGK